MRRRITWLVAATTSAVVIAFVIPLCLLVRALAEDRAVAGASEEARSVAVLVAGVSDQRQLGALVAMVDQRSPRTTSVVLPGGEVLGAARPDAAADPELRRAREGEAFTALDATGARVLVPVLTDRGTVVVRTAIGAADLHRGVAAAWTSILGLGGLLLLLALVVADQLGRKASSPITELAQVAHRLRAGEREARARPAGPPEAVELGNAINLLADRIGQLLAAEREAVADLSHRLRTPVTALRLDAEAVRDTELADRLREHVEHLQRTIDVVVRDARRPVHAELTRCCDAAAVVADRVRFWSALAEDQGRPLTVDLPTTPLRAAIDASELRDVIDVLIDNVFTHTREGTPLSVRLAAEPSGGVRLEVLDHGPGMPGPWLAERGHSTSGSTGLGLDIARRAAHAAGGRMVVERPTAGGHRVTVTLGPPRG